MTRSHRTIHLTLWLALALAVAIGFAAALYFRPPVQAAAPHATVVAQT
ncbi:MAG: hypothetical protein HY659_07830 [Rhizobiales bacterium]|nr:hypothetical protein [Hyphomicrobiales bacterium]